MQNTLSKNVLPLSQQASQCVLTSAPFAPFGPDSRRRLFTSTVSGGGSRHAGTDSGDFCFRYVEGFVEFVARVLGKSLKAKRSRHTATHIIQNACHSS